MTNEQESEEVRLFKETKIKAEEGDEDAQWELGWMYYKGQGVPKNYKKAAKWFRKEAKQYRKAAEQGHAGSQFSLGCVYARENEVVPENDKKAVKWLRKAAKQGHDYAQSKLGQMYYRGVKDYKKAAKWFRKAAEQGDADAQFELSWMYYKGRGVPKNDVEAYAWYLLAEANGNERANEGFSLLEKLLTAEQIEKGQARAAELHRLIKERKENPKPSVESP